MIKKIFNNSNSPQNIGKTGIAEEDISKNKLLTYISIPALKSAPVEQLVKTLTIGSKVGDLIVPAETGIADRHCTFSKNKDVIAIMDHSSSGGTFLNGKRLNSGRMYILSDEDKIQICEYSIVIQKSEGHEFVDKSERNLVSDMQEDSEQAPPPVGQTQEISLKELTEDSKFHQEDRTSEFDVPLFEATQEITIARILNKDKSNVDDAADMGDEEIEEIDDDTWNEETSDQVAIVKSKVVKVAGSRIREKQVDIKVKKYQKTSTSMVPRLIAMINDMLIVGIVFEIFYVFTDFKRAIEQIGGATHSVVAPLYDSLVKEHIDSMVSQLPALAKMHEDLSSVVSLPYILNFMLVLVLFRIVSGMIFGVSLGQKLIGLKAQGSFVLSRLMLPIREALGLILAPFIIFDIPTIIGKRSFKELITGTQIVTPNNVKTFLGSLIVTPLLVILFLFSPLVKGLDYNRPLKIERVMFKGRKTDFKYDQSFSKLKLSIDSDGKKYEILPAIQVKKVKGKRKINNGILIFSPVTDSNLEIRLLKRFNMKDIYKRFLDGNVFAEFMQKNIYSYTRDVSNKNKNFKSNLKNKNLLLAETEELILDVLTLDLGTLPNFVIKNGPILKGARNFRDAFVSIYPDQINSGSLLKLGDQRGLLAEHGQGRGRYYTFLALEGTEARLYKFSKDPRNKETLKITKRISWQESSEVEDSIISTFLESLALVLTQENIEQNQLFYEELFRLAQVLIENESVVSRNQYIKELQRILRVLGEKPGLNSKLFQNMTELVQALKISDKGFFNLNTTEII